MENKTSEAQIRASKKWNQANKEKVKYNRAKSATRRFIAEANREDVLWIEESVRKRKTELEEAGQ